MYDESWHKYNVFDIQYEIFLDRREKNRNAMMNVHKRHNKSNKSESTNTKTAFVIFDFNEFVNANENLKTFKNMSVKTKNNNFAKKK